MMILIVVNHQINIQIWYGNPKNSSSNNIELLSSPPEFKSNINSDEFNQNLAEHGELLGAHRNIL